MIDLELRTRIVNSRCFMDDQDREILDLAKDEDPYLKRTQWGARQIGYFRYHVMPRVPDQARTMGIGTILKARKILLLVSGATKTTALRLALTSQPGPEVPASFLRYHENVTVIADAAAVKQLLE